MIIVGKDHMNLKKRKTIINQICESIIFFLFLLMKKKNTRNLIAKLIENFDDNRGNMKSNKYSRRFASIRSNQVF